MSIDIHTGTAAKDRKWLHIQVKILGENVAWNDHLNLTADVLEPNGWTPWICNRDDEPEFVARLALNRHLREAGYLHQGALASVAPLAVQVSWFDESTPRHPSGSPMRCRSILYTVNQ